MLNTPRDNQWTLKSEEKKTPFEQDNQVLKSSRNGFFGEKEEAKWELLCCLLNFFRVYGGFMTLRIPPFHT